VDALTILLSYMKAGLPNQKLSGLGSFQEWSDLVRNALVWAGEPDPCEGRKLAHADQSPDTENLETILDAWFTCYQDKEIPLNKIDSDLKSYTYSTGIDMWNNLRDALATLDPHWNGKQLNLKSVGNRLRTYQGRRLGDKRLVRVKSSAGHQKVALWKIEKF
jgi:putative DNA primase/helicase